MCGQKSYSNLKCNTFIALKRRHDGKRWNEKYCTQFLHKAVQIIGFNFKNCAKFFRSMHNLFVLQR